MQAVLDAKGALSKSDLLRCRVRYFADGAVIGSRGFVNEAFASYRKQHKLKRKEGARKMRGGDWGDMFSARDLQRDPVAPP